MERRSAIAIGLAFVIACSDPSPTTTVSTVPTTSLNSFRPDPIVFLPGFDAAFLDVGAAEWTVAVANTPELREQGLRGIADLSWVEGMIFEWDAEVSVPFSMPGVLMTLDVAFISEEGRIIEVLTAEPCDHICPEYTPALPYRYALVAPRGAFDALGGDLFIRGLPPTTLTEFIYG